jgi:hypothetical protein
MYISSFFVMTNNHKGDRMVALRKDIMAYSE